MWWNFIWIVCPHWCNTRKLLFWKQLNCWNVTNTQHKLSEIQNKWWTSFSVSVSRNQRGKGFLSRRASSHDNLADKWRDPSKTRQREISFSINKSTAGQNATQPQDMLDWSKRDTGAIIKICRYAPHDKLTPALRALPKFIPGNKSRVRQVRWRETLSNSWTKDLKF